MCRQQERGARGAGAWGSCGPGLDFQLCAEPASQSVCGHKNRKGKEGHAQKLQIPDTRMWRPCGVRSTGILPLLLISAAPARSPNARYSAAMAACDRRTASSAAAASGMRVLDGFPV